MSRARDTSEIYVDGINDASDSAKGVVELATEAETQAGSDTTRAITPAGIESRLGTASAQDDTRYAHRSNNLSDLGSASTARTNLGLGTAALDDSDSAIVELGGDFNAGEEVLCTRSGVPVTITGIGALGHTSSSTPLSSSSVIPTTYRPSADTSTVFDATTLHVSILAILSDGQLRIRYWDWAGSGTSVSGTGYAPTISYNIT